MVVDETVTIERESRRTPSATASSVTRRAPPRRNDLRDERPPTPRDSVQGMAERKPVVGLSWQPQFSIPSSSKVTHGSHAKPHTEASNNALWKSSSELVDGLFVPPNNPKNLNKLLKKQAKDTAGNNWFNMPAQTITPELQKDLKLLKVGTVVDSPLDFFSGRLTKKERKATLADELLSDQNLAAYRKRKVREIEEQNRPGGNEKWKIKGSNSRKRAKERRIY
ncbi:uncharacterized protein HKW66_Vig0166910 [Vigna angularis]|uniref:Fcf2 pre-rRNA processing C-terminal domain-containing protein n=1 Tax=Phaseolus angularis TaxID=3914 RepID=A0A8T0JNV4_PHAAN|nr:uncharacterized protein HKW66_Vig0166910 [Vigna angularis]